MCPFNTALGRRRVSANTIDIELKERPPELRVAWTFDRSGAVDAKDAGLVAVERQRLAVARQVLACGLKISERRLGTGKTHHHQAARRIVDINDRCAHRRAILEPAMLTAVDLDQLAQARTPSSRLLDLRRPQLAGNPQS